jgi:hypothetical protein
VANTTNDGSPGIITAHSLPFTPLLILQWSNTSDFTVTNELQDAEYVGNTFTTGAGQSYLISSDATNANITRYNFSGSSQTLYYRMFGFMPSDANADSEVPSTSNLGSPFI